VITESMACSLPIVSTQLVGVPEMVDDGQTGILVESGNADAFAEALKRLAGDRDLARAMGKAGREKALKVFELEITAGELAKKFIQAGEAASDGSSVSKARSQPSTLYLVNEWPTVDECLDSEIRYVARHHSQEVQVMAAGLSSKIKASDEDVFDSLEYFPDGIVLEAEWLFSQAEASQVMAWRSELGSGVSTEDYLMQARRALHLCRMIKKRGILHLHATRADMVLCAWMAYRLTGVDFSMAIEAKPGINRSALDKIAAEAVLTSRADFDGGDDLLELCPVDRKRRLKVGPLKIKLPGQMELPDRTPVYGKWFDQLLKISRHE